MVVAYCGEGDVPILRLADIPKHAIGTTQDVAEDSQDMEFEGTDAILSASKTFFALFLYCVLKTLSGIQEVDILKLYCLMSSALSRVSPRKCIRSMEINKTAILN